MKYCSKSTVKPLYFFEILGQIGQGQSKISAKMSAAIRSMQCCNKNFFGQDFDRGRRSEYTVYASATPLLLTLMIGVNSHRVNKFGLNKVPSATVHTFILALLPQTLRRPLFWPMSNKLRPPFSGP